MRRIVFAMLACATAAAADAPRFPGSPGSDPATHQPNDPDYATQWEMLSGVPAGFRGTLSDAERAMGVGMGVDRAWQLHTGTPDTILAVLDSGILWQTPDLVDRVKLETANLPLPAGSAVYDKNGDGRVSPADYAGDPRVTPTGVNGVPTAADLLRAFGGKGLPIAGWDFHEGTNDPADRTQFGHGTGEALDSTAALDNGIAGAGICGNCSFMPLRVNDSFVADSNAFARAVIYAVDHGAAVVQAALGGLDWSPFVKQALSYAYDHDVVVVTSAADEDSYHHNFPGTLDPALYVDALRFDTNDPLDASTFVNFNNCSNYGARVDVAASGRSCSSEATANLAGIVALTQSYARSLGTPLTAGELISLVKTTATDIDYGAADPTKYPTYAGWDSTTGYGRVNAYAMLDAVRRGAIPPEARIVSPAWFDVFADGGSFDVAVQAKVPRSGSFKARLEIARGVETSASAFETVYESPILTTGLNGTFATVTPTQVAALAANTLDAAHDQNALTLRLVVDDLKGHVAEARRTVFAWRDPDLLPGFPKKLNGSGESSGLFVDLLGDGRQEYLTADGAGYVHAVTGTGDELPGFPAPTALSRYATPATADDSTSPRHVAGDPTSPRHVAGDPTSPRHVAGDASPRPVAVDPTSLRPKAVDLSPRPVAVDPTSPRPVAVDPTSLRHVAGVSQNDVLAAVFAPIAAGDLAGDGKTEVVAVSIEGHVSVIEPNGSMRPGFPVQLPFPDMTQATADQVIAPGALAAPVLVDLSACTGGPKSLSIVVPGLDGRVYAFDQSGQAVPGFPVALAADGKLAKLVSSPAVAQIDADGCPDLILGSNHVGQEAGYLFAVNGRGTRAAKPIRSGFPARVPLFHDVVLPTVGTGIPTAPVVADVDGSGKKVIIVHGFVGKVYLIGLDGSIIRSLDLAVGTKPPSGDGFMLPAFGHPAVANLSGDGKTFNPITVGAGQRLLIALGLGGKRYTYEHMVGAWNPTTGAMLPAFPKINDDMALGVAPIVADVDGSGKLSVIASSGGYFLHGWRADASTPGVEAAGFPHFTGGWILGSASAGDLEGNGRLTLAATTREGYLFAWRSQGQSTPQQAERGWLTFKGNPQRTGMR